MSLLVTMESPRAISDRESWRPLKVVACRWISSDGPGYPHFEAGLEGVGGRLLALASLEHCVVIHVYRVDLVCGG